jgi:hypothetical protein
LVGAMVTLGRPRLLGADATPTSFFSKRNAKRLSVTPNFWIAPTRLREMSAKLKRHQNPQPTVTYSFRSTTIKRKANLRGEPAKKRRKRNNEDASYGDTNSEHDSNEFGEYKLALIKE